VSTQTTDFALPEPTTLTEKERNRLVDAINWLLPMLSDASGVSKALRTELEAAQLLASAGCYHYDSMSSLLAKQMFHLAELNVSADVKEAAGEVIKAHLDVGLRT
jgi:hypothetical protein